MKNLDWNAWDVYFAIIAFLVPVLILASNWFLEYTGIKSNKRKRDEANESFNKVVENLSSENTSSQLSAAVLLRRFFNKKIGKTFYLRKETIGVISAILRTLPAGVYQKTLADGLAYADDLSFEDLQRTNLQNIYLGSKQKRVRLEQTDLFMANLSYGLIDKVDAPGVILYNAILFHTRIKDSDFSNADFTGADLSNISFVNVNLKGAKFSRATNIPEDLQAHLNSNYVFGEDTKTDNVLEEEQKDKKNVNFTSKNSEKPKTIFFSMPGNMSKDDEAMVAAYRDYLTKNLRFEIVYYNRDTYPRFGQLSKIKSSIEKCAALIAFGTKQTFIKEGTYRPGMIGERQINQGWLSTPWNEVEVGMATMAGIPILLIKDDDIDDGIFDDIISEAFIYTLSSKTDIKELDNNPTFKEWKGKINFTNSEQENKDKKSELAVTVEH
jgi:uncharacterized protein YjbI with pentapeptide repeats